MNNFNAKEVKDRIVSWIRNWFAENGPECNAIIGISGGVDSSVVAALLVEALGTERVIGIFMPDGEQQDIDYSKMLVDYLGISNYTVNIHESVQGVLTNMGIPVKEQTTRNLPPRIRMATLYAMSQSLNGRVANTCNLSESWVGWDTRWGDSVGDFSPLSNLTKSEVKLIGYELGLPKELIEKIPLDGLCGKTDEESFGFSYDVLDRYIRTGKIDDISIKEKIDTMHQKNLFKQELMSKFEL